MREIKFRAWDRGNKKMRTDILVGRQNGSAWVESFDGGVFEGDLLQYTGLKDKNGKEIYEGDIVRFWGHYDDNSPINLEVKWDENNCFYRGYFSKVEGHKLDRFEEFEVIGNIYENKDLLNGI